MNTPYSYTTKEQRQMLKAMPEMTGGRFNRFFDLYTRRLVSGLSDEHELDNLKFQLSSQFADTITYINSEKAIKVGWKHAPYMPVPFNEQMIDAKVHSREKCNNEKDNQELFYEFLLIHRLISNSRSSQLLRFLSKDCIRGSKGQSWFLFRRP